MREEFGAQAEAWSAEQVQEQLKSPLYQNAIHFPRAFHIHPMNYAMGLAAAAEQAGVRIFEHTPALSLDPAGIRKRVGTPSARVRAAQIVLAGNTGLGALMPRLADSLAADHDLCGDHRAARRKAERSDHLSRAASATASLPTAITASSTATA